MEAYVPYYSLFAENTKIIKDTKVDFTQSGYLGNDFDENYRKFLRKLGARCQTAASGTILGSSKVISDYVKAIHETESLQQGARFDTLLSITERFMRMVS